VSLSLGRGETLGVVGESGSGKSVLARTIMRLNPSDALTVGSIWFDGRNLAGASDDELAAVWGAEMAMVFQDATTSLNPVTRVGRLLMEPLRIHLGLQRRAAWERAVELLRQVGVPDPERRMRTYPHELSGGMRQRVSIAISIACSPKL